jgi:alpha-beta hydrolase superfamily lysophospholipase/nitrate reductase NapE component
LTLKEEGLKMKKAKSKKEIVFIVILSIILSLIVLMIVGWWGFCAKMYDENFNISAKSYEPLMLRAEDFDSLECAEYSFPSDKGQMLAGYLYSIGEDQHGTVIIAHGFGDGGHNSYMDVADFFARNGYYVFAYDATAMDKSEGEGLGGVPQGVIDLEHAISFVESNNDIPDLPIVLFGHSWGGYTALGACREQFGVNAVISIAGFVSAVDMVCARAKGLEKFRFFVKNAIHLGYGKIGASDITECVRSSRARVLYIQGENDQAVPLENGIKRIQAAFPRDSRVQTVLIPESGHNPYWTKGGQLYMIDLARNHRYVSCDFDNQTVVDYARLNDDDPSFMKMMSDFLENIDKPSLGE